MNEKDKTNFFDQKVSVSVPTLLVLGVLCVALLGFSLYSQITKSPEAQNADVADATLGPRSFLECVQSGAEQQINEDVLLCTTPQGFAFESRCEDVENPPEICTSDETVEMNDVSENAEDTESDEISAEDIEFPTVPVPIESCNKYEHDTSGPIADSYEKVTEWIIGEWRGCVNTPWTAPYKADVEFLDNGRYVAQNISNPGEPVFYWGTANSHPSQVFSVDDYQDNGFSIGSLTIKWPGSDGTERAFPLTNIKITGNTMEFMLDRQGVAGPLEFQMVRKNQE